MSTFDPLSSPSSACRSSRRWSRVPPAPARPGPFEAYRRLTTRDRLLLSWLAEHYLLSSAQIARALFANPRTARLRLTILHRLGFLTAIPYGRDDGGALPWLYTLGPLGLDLHPQAYSDPDNRKLRPPRSSLERPAASSAAHNSSTSSASTSSSSTCTPTPAPTHTPG
jgi:DNA-binding CsgD family transcriptional regulator